MANAYTTPADVFKPERVGPAILAYAYANQALLSSGYIGTIGNAIWSAGGNQLTFPRYKGFTGTSSANLSDGSKVDSKKIEIDTVTATAVSRILSVAVDKVTLECAIAELNFSGGISSDTWDMIITQIAVQQLDEIDKAVVAEAETTTLAIGTTAVPVTISYDQVVNALALWGDKAQRADAALVVHSNIYKQILKIADFKDAAKFGAPTSITGQIPFLAGLPVFVSDNITKTTVPGTPDVVSYTNLIVKRGAVRYCSRAELEIEVKTEPGNTMRYLDADWRYLVDLETPATGREGAIKLIASHAA